MILDTLDRLDKYGFISPMMDKVLDFFRKTDLSTLAPGRIVSLARILMVCGVSSRGMTFLSM